MKKTMKRFWPFQNVRLCLSNRSNKAGKPNACDGSKCLYPVYGLQRSVPGACAGSPAGFAGEDKKASGCLKDCPQGK